MKIKGIFTICKKRKQVVLFNRYTDYGETVSQYISDGHAVYPLSGLPVLDEESLLTILDVPEKQREDWRVECKPLPEGINLEDTDGYEEIVEKQGDISIVYAGTALKPLRTRRGLIFIESKYLAPIADVLDVLELYERRTEKGQPYIVAKAGFMLQAVIMPENVITAAFVEKMEGLTQLCGLALADEETRKRAEAEQQAAASGVREYTIADIDPETGEIIEDTEDSEDEKEV